MLMVFIAIIYIYIMVYSSNQKPTETWNINIQRTRKPSITITIEDEENQPALSHNQETLDHNQENPDHNLAYYSCSQRNHNQSLSPEKIKWQKSISKVILYTNFIKSTKSSRRLMIISHQNDVPDDDDNLSFIMKNRLLKTILFPVSLLFKLTIPKRWIILTFSMSMIWLALLSWLTVQSISSFSDDFNIPKIIAGMTIVVAGSLIPDLMTSIIIVKRTCLASVGICAAIASNIYVILIGLGIPWFIQSIINWVNTHQIHEAHVTISTTLLSISSYMMLIVICLFIIILKLFSWQINYKLSWIFLSLYVIFLAVLFILEFNLIF